MPRMISQLLKLILISSILALINGPVNAQDKQYNHPGGVIELELLKQTDELPELKFGLAEPVIIEYKDHWRVLLGINLDTLPGQYVLYYKPNFEGASGEYKEVYIQQKAQPFVVRDSSKDLLDAANITHQTLSDLDYSNSQQPSLPLLTPVSGTWSDNFGYNFFDEKKKSVLIPNSAVLLSSSEGYVVSPQNAIVSRISTDKLGLSTLYLDHGRGLYSVLIGIQDITVETGNGIVAGAVLGRLMDDDFSSQNKQPKLIWQTIVNGAYVNPAILSELEP